MSALFVASGIVAVWLVGRRWLDVVEVHGRSMEPALFDGDLVLVECLTYGRRVPRRGEVVLAADPRRSARELIKRVVAVRDEGVDLRGDNRAATTDSFTFGPVPSGRIEWRALVRYWPLQRLGPVPALIHEVAAGGEPACSAFGDLVVGI